jgi:hypothetical protein
VEARLPGRGDGGDDLGGATTVVDAASSLGVPSCGGR